MQYLAAIAFALWCALALVHVVHGDSQEVEDSQLFFDRVGGVVGGIVRSIDDFRSHPRSSATDALKVGHRAFKNILDSSLGLRIAAAVFRSRACKSDGGRTAFSCRSDEQDFGKVTTVVGQVVRCCMQKPRPQISYSRKPWRPNYVPWARVRKPRQVTVNAIIAKPIDAPKKPTRKLISKPNPAFAPKKVPSSKGTRNFATRPLNRNPTPPARKVVTRPVNLPRRKPIPIVIAKPKRQISQKAAASRKIKSPPNNGRWIRPVFKARIPEATRAVPARHIPLARYRVIRYANPRFYSGIRPFGWPYGGVYYRGRFTSGVW